MLRRVRRVREAHRQPHALVEASRRPHHLALLPVRQAVAVAERLALTDEEEHLALAPDVARALALRHRTHVSSG